MLELNWKNATAEALDSEKHGITKAELRAVARDIRKAHRRVVAQCRSGELGYAKLPTTKKHALAVRKLVRKFRSKRRRGPTTDMLVLGIGGSALGNLAVHAALKPATYNLLPDKRRGGPRLFVLDNVDPALVADTLDLLGPRLRTTLVNVISKSGDTAETAGQFMIVREMLRERLGKAFARRIVTTTDTRRGTLHDIAADDGYDTLVVPGDVGGRFSVLSAVGLFSAAMCGIRIERLLAGAAAMKRRVQRPAARNAWRSNPACLLAAVKYLAMTAKDKPTHVMMPYSNRLYLLADWYRQLWAESLGKRLSRDERQVFTGPTPVKALGTTDQHSQVQLYREGPNDKLTVFLEVGRHPRRLRIPRTFGDVDGLAYLGGKDLGRLINAEKAATEYAMAVSQRPSVTIGFDRITPESVGEFLYLYEFTTSLMGELLDINAYDQPAVELGKRATFALMGRAGYRELARQIAPFITPDDRFSA
jgi:glucose-6-phosphate isomerase